jgi:hypothetical protein
VLKQAVRRNMKRFPNDFMFELSREEIMRISQIVTSSKIKYSKSVHAFTEQGVDKLVAWTQRPLINLEGSTTKGKEPGNK